MQCFCHTFNVLYFVLQPGVEPGDVIIVLQEKEHDTFQRKGTDLIVNYNLGLTEALCGFEFTLKQLDGRDLVIKNPRGKVIEPGELCTNLLHARIINMRHTVKSIGQKTSGQLRSTAKF